MIRYSVRLVGAGAKGARIRGALLRDLLDALSDAARGVVRMAVEGRSRARGTAPAWLTQAADFEVVGFAEGSTILELEELPLGEAVPDRFAQDDLFHPIDPARGAIAWFSRAWPMRSRVAATVTGSTTRSLTNTPASAESLARISMPSK